MLLKMTNGIYEKFLNNAGWTRNLLEAIGFKTPTILSVHQVKINIAEVYVAGANTMNRSIYSRER